MSNIPNSAMPHAWAPDSDHAREVRRARGEEGTSWSPWLKLAAGLGLSYLVLRIVRA